MHALRPYSEADGISLKFCEHYETIEDIPKGDLVFLNIRDPAKRFISAFYYVQGHHAPREHLPWNKEEEAFFEAFSTPNEALEALTSSNQLLRTTAEAGLTEAWHMRDKQVTWLGGMDYLKDNIDRVFHVNFNENLQEDFAVLLEKLNLPKTPLSTDTLSANIGPKDNDKFLSARAIKNLQKWYNEDFQMYYYFINQKKASYEKNR